MFDGYLLGKKNITVLTGIVIENLFLRLTTIHRFVLCFIISSTYSKYPIMIVLLGNNGSIVKSFQN